MRSPHRENLVVEIFALEGAQETVLRVAAFDARRVEHAATCEQGYLSLATTASLCKPELKQQTGQTMRHTCKVTIRLFPPEKLSGGRIMQPAAVVFIERIGQPAPPNVVEIGVAAARAASATSRFPVLLTLEQNMY